MPATAGRVPMPAGNRVVTSNALKVSDRWASIVGNDPYKSESADPETIDKMWSDPRLHGNKRKVGTDERGRPVFATANGAEKRAKRNEDALSVREREFELMQEKKRRMEELMAAEAELVEASKPASKKSKKEKKEKKSKKDKKSKKSKKSSKKSSKKKTKKASGSSSSSGSSSESEEDDPTEKFRLSGFFSKQ